MGSEYKGAEQTNNKIFKNIYGPNRTHYMRRARRTAARRARALQRRRGKPRGRNQRMPQPHRPAHRSHRKKGGQRAEGCAAVGVNQPTTQSPDAWRDHGCNRRESPDVQAAGGATTARRTRALQRPHWKTTSPEPTPTTPTPHRRPRETQQRPPTCGQRAQVLQRRWTYIVHVFDPGPSATLTMAILTQFMFA